MKIATIVLVLLLIASAATLNDNSSELCAAQGRDPVTCATVR